MKRRLFLFALLTTLGCNARALGWLTDLPTALNRAQQENKAVLLDFTGSDWCPWCQKLKAEVFDQPEFAAYAAANLVLVEVDFPQHRALTTEQDHANRALASKYEVRGFPTLILLNSDGEVQGQCGYVRGGPAAFQAQLEFLHTPQPSNGRPIRSARHRSEPPVQAPKPKPASLVLVAAPPLKYGELTLKGLSGVGRGRLALINNQSLMAGETAKVKSFGTNVNLTVKEIRDASVLILVNGQARRLNLPQLPANP